NEALYDFIRQTKAKAPSRAFDFEPSIDEAETLTTAKEMIFCLHWLKARGRAAQLVPPNLGFKKRQAYPETMDALRDYVRHKMWPELAPCVEGQYGGKPLEELAARVKELAAVARHFQGTLSIHSGSGKQAGVLQSIGRATMGRVNYKISGELQLQLFDVLSEQPAGSPWRALFERMVERANEFAGRGAFGPESELAALDRRPYLGDAARGRVDGNLFLVFWLGNVVGSRDVHSPDGDRRFFKDKIDELPVDLRKEVRRRNSDYITWIAGNLI
ncbi:MAG: tagaturonate epimerase family protein, partial [Acidobacteria bacterium]|nr:tagaturonate epimerase family protein [Acidobacteriota bacterium]